MTSGFETANPNMTQSHLFTRRGILGSAVAAFLLAALPRRAWSQTAADQATAFIDKTGQELTAAVNGSGSTKDKATALQAIIDRSVDVTSVGRFCLGRFWRLASAAEQAEYIELFHRVLVQNITGKVGDYQGVTITVVRTAQREDGVSVTTTVSRPNSAPNRVDWLVSTETGAPKIVDVIAEGTSLRLTQRNDYAAYLSRNNNSVSALISALKQQVSGG
jgi:phospholipid transport system substrate-binding protein